jgi:NAD+ diphosphatase
LAASDTAREVRVSTRGFALAPGGSLLHPVADPDGLLLLGVDDAGAAMFARLVDGGTDDDGFAAMRALLVGLADGDAAIAAYAMGLAQWHARHQFCAQCGGGTTVELAGHVRRCAACARDHHPRLDPAVIVLVTDADDRALLGRQGTWPAGRFSTLAGFVEPGESLEDAVRREVFEESSVRLTRVDYLASQPWPFPSSLMVGFAARVDGSPDPVPDGAELHEVAWFTRDDVTDRIAAGALHLPPPSSISRRLIDHWHGGSLPTTRFL